MTKRAFAYSRVGKQGVHSVLESTLQLYGHS